ncbi:MAG: hypothetical protein WCD37_18165 [Chloroflexia bacterium]
MDQWTYNILVVDMAGVMGNKPSITKMWEVRGPDGLTDWDRLQNMGRDGWELVTVLPVASGQGVTAQVVFTFKKRVKANP